MTDPSATSSPSAPRLVHEALMYRGEAELVEAVSAFIRGAVAAGEPVLLALPGEHLEQRDRRGLVTEISSDTVLQDRLAARCSRPDPAAPSGRGLWLINQVCDLVEMRSSEDGTTLRLHMDDEPAPDA